MSYDMKYFRFRGLTKRMFYDIFRLCVLNHTGKNGSANDDKYTRKAIGA